MLPPLDSFGPPPGPPTLPLSISLSVCLSRWCPYQLVPFRFVSAAPVVGPRSSSCWWCWMMAAIIMTVLKCKYCSFTVNLLLPLPSQKYTWAHTQWKREWEIAEIFAPFPRIVRHVFTKSFTKKLEVATGNGHSLFLLA